MLCAARQRLRASGQQQGAAPGKERPLVFLLSAVQTQGRSVNETLVLCILPSKADAQLADREARMELVVVLVELHQLPLHHPVCSLLASVSAASMSAYRSSSVMFCGSGLPARSQTSSASSMRSDGRGMPCMFIRRSDAGAGLIGTQDYSAADDDTDCHVNDVSAHCERLKILQEATFSHFFYFNMNLCANIKTNSYFCTAFRK